METLNRRQAAQLRAELLSKLTPDIQSKIGEISLSVRAISEEPVSWGVVINPAQEVTESEPLYDVISDLPDIPSQYNILTTPLISE